MLNTEIDTNEQENEINHPYENAYRYSPSRPSETEWIFSNFITLNFKSNKAQQCFDLNYSLKHHALVFTFSFVLLLYQSCILAFNYINYDRLITLSDKLDLQDTTLNTELLLNFLTPCTISLLTISANNFLTSCIFITTDRKWLKHYLNLSNIILLTLQPLNDIAVKLLTVTEDNNISGQFEYYLIIIYISFIRPKTLFLCLGYILNITLSYLWQVKLHGGFNGFPYIFYLNIFLRIILIVLCYSMEYSDKETFYDIYKARIEHNFYRNLYYSLKLVEEERRLRLESMNNKYF